MIGTATHPSPAEPDASAGEGHSLRERKKARTRQELMDAALDLFERQGFAATTVEEIVDAVGVSRRTFSRYFAVKEDVVVSFELDHYEEVVWALAERPADEPVMLALRNSILAAVGTHLRDGADRERFRRVQRLLATTPALLAHSLQRQRAVEERVAAVLAERLGADSSGAAAGAVGAGMTARLAVSLAHTAARVALDACADSAGGVSPEAYGSAVRAVFASMGRDIDFSVVSDTAASDTAASDTAASDTAASDTAASDTAAYDDRNTHIHDEEGR